MILRAFAVVVAFALLGASSHAIIVHVAGGYESPHAIVTLALAAGIAVGALAIGAAWNQRRRLLAFVLCIALLCGEAFGLVATAERIVAQRDAAQSVITKANSEREAAQRRLKDAEAALAKANTSERLQLATQAKAAADNAALTKAAERGCAGNCRALLEQQVSTAGTELANARAEVEKQRGAALAAVATARAAVDAARVPASATPLADRLGIEGWQLDVLIAALGSLAVNGLAAALLAFAGHGMAHRHAAASGNERRAHIERSRMEAARTIEAAPAIDAEEPPPATMRPKNLKEHAAKFGVECLEPRADAFASLEEIRARYIAWCAAIGVEPTSESEIGKALADLFRSVGLRAEDRGGRLVVVGIAIKTADGGRALLKQQPVRRMRELGETVENLCAASPSASNLRASA